MRLIEPGSAAGSGTVQPGGPSRPVAGIPRAPGQVWVEERTRLAVSRNMNVSGKLIFQEPVRIEGHFRGEVSSSELVVLAETATVEGRVKTPRVLVLGELRGEVVGARTVVLGPRARLTGTVETEHLTVCEGAFLEGDVRAAPGARHGT